MTLSTVVTENIVETSTAKTFSENESDDESKDNDNNQQTTGEEVAIVADNRLGAGEELKNNGNGNNEFETNMSPFSSSADDSDDIATATDTAATIENNEDTEEEIDNLNESSTNDESDDDAEEVAVTPEGSDVEADADETDNDAEDVAATPEGSDVESDAEDVEDVNVVVTNSNKKPYAAIRNKYREDVSSSDDEQDPSVAAAGMHPTFNDEWGSYSEEQKYNRHHQQIGFNKENNDLSNDIDVYDVEPIDLSNDIAVNDAPNLAINPDAEFVDIFGAKQSLASMPKFEKLSLSQTPDDDGEHLSSFSGEMK